MGYDKVGEVKLPQRHGPMLKQVRDYLSNGQLEFRPQGHRDGDDLRVQIPGHPDFAAYLRLKKNRTDPNYGVFIATLVERQAIVTHGDELRRLLPALGGLPPRLPEQAAQWAWFGYHKGLSYEPEEDGLAIRLASELWAYTKGLEFLVERSG